MTRISNASVMGRSGRPGVLLSGLSYGESPRWHKGRLWFCHWGAGQIVAVNMEGRSEVVASVKTTIPFSIDWLPDGRLLVVSGRERFLLRQEANGSLVTHADLRNLTEHVCNEIVVDGHGSVYVNAGALNGRGGVIIIVGRSGSARQVADGLAFPNGMAVTPDNSTLIVAESFARRLTAFEICPDGGLSNRRIWAGLGDDNPDGICIDEEGSVWYADVPHKRCVRVREGGEILHTVELGRGCFACMLGGPDRRTLFMLEAEFRGFEHMFDGPPTGRVTTIQAPSPGTGWP